MGKKHATTGKATPAISQLENAGITFRVVDYEHDADHMDEGYGMEAAQKLGVNAEQVCKTLMVDTGEKPRRSSTRKWLCCWRNQPIWSAHSSRNCVGR